jgi:hypothetical protein
VSKYDKQKRKVTVEVINSTVDMGICIQELSLEEQVYKFKIDFNNLMFSYPLYCLSLQQ